jgi:hypothetical protein
LRINLQRIFWAIARSWTHTFPVAESSTPTGTLVPAIAQLLNLATLCPMFLAKLNDL